MSAFDSRRPVPLGAVTTHRLVVVFDRLIGEFRAWRMARATETALARLSDHELLDIGLSRGQIAEVAERLARN